MIEKLRIFLDRLRQSSVIFCDLYEMFGNVHLAFEQISENLRKVVRNLPIFSRVEIDFSTLEGKFRISARPCNMSFL